MIDKDHIQAQARSAARKFATLNEACPYPFSSEAGSVFKEAFLAARAGMQAVDTEQGAPWLLMNTAREHRLVDYFAHPVANPVPYMPPLGEIGHSLAHINRFTGHACRAYSVAEHSLLVADMAAQDGHGYMVEICALMHDAHESVTGDVSTPAKQILGNAWARFENAQQHALLAAYGLVVAMEQHKALIKHYDLKALSTERRDLLPFDPAVHTPWPLIDTPGAQIQPHADADLMCKGRVAITPAAWANLWKWRTAALIAIVLEQAEATAKEAA